MAVLRLYGAEDLAEVLGLTPGPETAPERPTALKAVTVRSVPCPQCGAGVGEYCTSANDVPSKAGHRGRQRRAQEIREGAA